MSNHRSLKSDCTEHRVPICEISEIIIDRQAKHMAQTGKYLSVPKAIIEIVLESKMRDKWQK
jgi:hypothetical protein